MSTSTGAIALAVALLTSTLERTSGARVRDPAALGWARAGAASFGPCAAEELRGVAEKLPLSAEMWEFYTCAGPLQRVQVPPEVTLMPGRELVAYQSGYRWHGADGMRLGEAWPDSWIAIGDSAADPFIADTAMPGTPVGIAVHGTGAWEPFWVAPTLADFVRLLACYTEIRHRYDGSGPVDDDGEEAFEAWLAAWPTAYEGQLVDLLRTHAPAVDADAYLEYLRI
jgi:hypothetical protein